MPVNLVISANGVWSAEEADTNQRQIHPIDKCDSFRPAYLASGNGVYAADYFGLFRDFYEKYFGVF